MAVDDPQASCDTAVNSSTDDAPEVSWKEKVRRHGMRQNEQYESRRSKGLRVSSCYFFSMCPLEEEEGDGR